ncbi:Phosphoglycolate phosphatase [Bienertia sinuspersici]
MIKLNVDASLKIEGWDGFSAIACDSTGEVVLAAVRRVQSHWSVLLVEAKALEFAIKMGKSIGLQDMIIEMDCLELVKQLSCKEFYLTELGLMLTAHSLALFIPSRVEQVWDCCCPSFVSSNVLMDKLLTNE